MRPLDWPALAVFGFFFCLVTVAGFLATRWRPALNDDHIDQWGLAGRQFGTWVVWFLIGGDFYTAYTLVAVPALTHVRGAYGFFALPYAIIVYPIVFLIMPPLWTAAYRGGCVTAGDLVFERYKSRLLELAVAVTGVLATMPYIALQLVGMGVAIKALGLPAETSLVAAFGVLALYTYSSGLRAPALIAVIKDVMIYIVVLVAAALIPIKLGGFGAVFAAADAAFVKTTPAGMTWPAGILLAPGQGLPYATLALGSALAAFMYPHTLTGVLSAKSAETVRRNASLLPIYTGLLALVAMLGYTAHAAGVHLDVSRASDVVPDLFLNLFPSWFAGFALAAIVIGALAPAAMMSIGSANLFARNFWKAYVDPVSTPSEEAQVAKIVSLLVKLGALAFTLFLPLQFAIDLQLLGGLWILQTFPAVVFGLFTNWFRAPGLLIGWAVGFFGGTAVSISDGLSPLHAIAPGYSVYLGLLALVANISVGAAISAWLNVAQRRSIAA